LGAPARLFAYLRARTEDRRRLRQGERVETQRPALLELLRRQLPEVHGQPPQSLVWRCRDEVERVCVRLHPQAGEELVVDEHLRSGAQGDDAGPDPEWD